MFALKIVLLPLFHLSLSLCPNSDLVHVYAWHEIMCAVEVLWKIEYKAFVTCVIAHVSFLCMQPPRITIFRLHSFTQPTNHPHKMELVNLCQNCQRLLQKKINKNDSSHAKNSQSKHFIQQKKKYAYLIAYCNGWFTMTISEYINAFNNIRKPSFPRLKKRIQEIMNDNRNCEWN